MGAALLALGASLTWGVGDFLGGLKARVLPALIVLAVSQPFGLAALGLAVAVRETGIPGDEVAWSALAAVFGTVGLFAFYRGMAAGAISVVTPIAAVAAGIPVIWGVIVSGDRISGLQAIGFVAAVGGSVAASIEVRPERRQLAAESAGDARDACLRRLLRTDARSLHPGLALAGVSLPVHVGDPRLDGRAHPTDAAVRPPPALAGLVAIGLLDTARERALRGRVFAPRPPERRRRAGVSTRL